MEFRFYKIVARQVYGHLVPALSTGDMSILEEVLSYDSIFKRTIPVKVLDNSWREFHPCLLRVSGTREGTMVVLLARTCKKLFNVVQKFMNPQELSWVSRNYLFLTYECKERETFARTFPSQPRSKVIDLVSDSESDSDSDCAMEVANTQIVLSPQPPVMEDFASDLTALPVQSYDDFDVNVFLY